MTAIADAAPQAEEHDAQGYASGLRSVASILEREGYGIAAECIRLSAQNILDRAAEIERLTAALAEAERERDALKEDAERVEWVEAHPTLTPTYASGYLRAPSSWTHLMPDGFAHASAETFRAAIDAARLSPPAADAQEGR